MSGKHTSLALPLSLEQPEQWPFDIIIRDADGVAVIHERRTAHTSADKSVADALSCRHFDDPVERSQYAAANARQLAGLQYLARACNAHEAMREALKAVADHLSEIIAQDGGCDHSVGICWCPDIRALDEARAALKLAEES